MVDENEEHLPALRWVRSHPAIVLTSVPVLLAIVKVAAASRFVLPTQLAIATAADPVQILTGTLITLLPAASILIFAFALVLFFTQKTWVKNAGFLGAVLAGAGLVWIPIVTGILPAAVSVLAVALVARIMFADRSILEMMAIVACVTLVLSSATSGVWLPRELITTTDGLERVGYVLDSGVDPVPVLLATSRTVVLISQDEVEVRVHCRRRRSSRSLADLVLRRPSLATAISRCPSIADLPT